MRLGERRYGDQLAERVTAILQASRTPSFYPLYVRAQQMAEPAGTGEPGEVSLVVNTGPEGCCASHRVVCQLWDIPDLTDK